MSVTYRTSGSWGPGKGGLLTPEEVDNNFWELVQDIAAKAVQGVGITNFNVTGDQMYVVLSDHTLLGPYTLPTAQVTFQGTWLPTHQYYTNDIFTFNGSTYIVLINHVSVATFDPFYNDGSGHDYYALLLENPTMSIPSGGAPGTFLRKATSADWVTHWATAALEELNDVIVHGPTTGEVLTYSGGFWQNSALPPPPATPSLRHLTDVLASPSPSAGDVVFWNGGAFSYLAQSSIVAKAPILNFTDLADVLASPGPALNQLVQYDGSKFTYVNPTLGMLEDVQLGYLHAETSGDFLGWDTTLSKLVNKQLFNYLNWGTTPDTLVLNYGNTLLDWQSSGLATLTIPPNSTTEFPAGFIFWMRQGGQDPAEIAAGAGVTLQFPPGKLTRTRSYGSVICAQRTSTTDTWVVFGDLACDTGGVNVLPGTVGAMDPRLAISETFVWTPTGNSTVTLVSGSVYMGQRMTLIITTSGTSSYNLTFSTGFKSQGVLATGTVSGKVFTIDFVSNGTSLIEVSRTTAM